MQTRQRNTKRSPTCACSWHRPEGISTSSGSSATAGPARPWTWVTFDTPDVPEVLAGERVVYARHPTNRNIPNLLRNAVLAIHVIRGERPRE